VVGSRGSVIPLFRQQREQGRITVTDPRMTRFWITLEQGVRFVIRCLEEMRGGEVFIPKIPSMNLMDLAQAMAPDCEVQTIGMRPGEKLHEVLISEDEARNTLELPDKFVVMQPYHPRWVEEGWRGGTRLPDGYRYGSDNNTQWLKVPALQELAAETE
jgi:FlaA1/EpsC-like NDP-sugar epimerase